MKAILIVLLFLSGISLSSGETDYVVCELMDDLGDNLFQVATTYAVAWDHNATPYIFCGEKDNSLNSISPLFFRCNQQNGPHQISFIWKDPSRIYHEIPYKANMKLFGYFCSPKHFQHRRNELLKLFAPSPEVLNYIANKYRSILKHPSSIGVHIQHQMNDVCGTEYLQYGTDYLRQAMKGFSYQSLYVISSNNMDFAKSILPQEMKNVIFIEDEPDYIALFLLNLCKHNIISNSSFGWWSAWLNQNPKQVVICPKNWWPFLTPLPLEDYTPAIWNKIDSKGGPLCLPLTWQ